MFNPHKLVLKLERMAKKYPVERSKFIKCYLAGSFIFSRDEYKEKILLPFEDTEFFAPAEYDSILKKEYGNKKLRLLSFFMEEASISFDSKTARLS